MSVIYTISYGMASAEYTAASGEVYLFSVNLSDYDDENEAKEEALKQAKKAAGEEHE